MSNIIEISEVNDVQKLWGDGLVEIGRLFLDKSDYKSCATELLEKLYGYNSVKKKVLFKPTKAKEIPFRNTFEGALSYFIGGNSNFPEDKGFAIEPWKRVEFNNHDVYIQNDLAIAMGEYTFTKYNDEKVKVEFTFGYIKENDNLKIITHHSSLPFGF